MEKLLIRDEISIENMIYEIRGKQVMLDSDLAKLYQVETKRINEAVKRNYEKFPERFSWLLSNNEISILWSQNATANISSKSRTKPRVFTEQGVAMLATILKSYVATKVSIRIMDAFVAMRKYISSNMLEQKYINNQVMKNTEDIKLLQESFRRFDEKKIVNEIYFKGQIYDAYSKIIDIFNTAKEELIIIDNYADKTVLDMIKHLNIKAYLITKKNSLLTKLDLLKYNQEYHNLKVIYDDSFHDRYFIIDNNIIYHCGASINYAGSRTFSINILDDKLLKETLIDNINLIINNKKCSKK